MKTTSLLVIATTSLALFLSCEAALKETIQAPEASMTDNEEVVFYASAETPSATKAAVQEDAHSIWWEPGDQIKVFRGDDSGVFTTTIEEPSANAEFSGSFSSTSTEGDTFYAVYPASAVESFDGTVFTINIPSEQRPPKGSFDRDALVSIAKSTSRNLYFHLAIGGIKFSVSRPDIDKVVVRSFEYKTSGSFSITLKSSGIPVLESEEAASNTITLTPGDGGFFEPGAYYYAALFPKTFVRLQLSVYSADQLIGVYGPGFKDIKRASAGVLSNLDKKLDYSADDIPVPEAVDLGLPSGTLWASYNLGASSPEESGYYYAWGEVSPKNYYNWKTYLWCDGSSNMLTKYNSVSSNGVVDGKTSLDPNDDAASVSLGDGWQMPTPDDIQELIDNCTWTWKTLNDVKGYNIVSKMNYAQIFIPAAGKKEYGDRVDSMNSEGMYLSNTAWATSVEVRILLFSSSAKYLNSTRAPYSSRANGLTIRPVRKPYITEPRFIEVSPISYTLEVGETFTINATVGPEGNYDHTVTWKSSNPSIASVDNAGNVTAVAEGIATITARTTNNLTAECKVTVTKPTIPVTGISISNETLSLFVDASAQLTASVIPSNATVKDVTWSSDKATVASVSTVGMVRAISSGTATITATSKDGGFKKSCIVTVTPEMQVPTAVDLGLSVKWASFNIGASAPEEEGCLYAWGEIRTKDEYTVANYKWWDYRYMGSSTYTRILSKYKGENDNSNNDNTLEEEDDVANVKYGDKWHMPSCIQIKELVDNCEWTYTRVGNVSGYKIQSKKNTNYIFIPYGGYWSSSLDSSLWYRRLKQKGIEVGGINNYCAYAYWGNELGTEDRSAGNMVRAVYGED